MCWIARGSRGCSANTGRKNFGRGVWRHDGAHRGPVHVRLRDARERPCRPSPWTTFWRTTGPSMRGCWSSGPLASRWRTSVPRCGSRPPGASPLLDEAERTAKEIEAEYQEKLPIIKNPARAAVAAQRIRELAARPGTREPGGVQDPHVRVARHRGDAASPDRRLSRDGQAAEAAGGHLRGRGSVRGEVGRANPQARGRGAQEAIWGGGGLSVLVRSQPHLLHVSSANTRARRLPEYSIAVYDLA